MIRFVDTIILLFALNNNVVLLWDFYLINNIMIRWLARTVREFIIIIFLFAARTYVRTTNIADDMLRGHDNIIICIK